MSAFPIEKQMEAACMVHPYEAAQILGLRDENRPNGIPSREWLSEQFNFSPQDLHTYILDAPTRAGEIYNRSLDNRSTPAPYIWAVGDGFHVGWYDGPPDGFHGVLLHQHMDEAATDLVLTYWGLPRLPGVPVLDRKAAEAFHTTHTPPAFARLAAAIRGMIDKWTGC